MANARTVTSSGSIAFFSRCHRTPPPPLSRCRLFRGGFRQGHHSMGPMASLCHLPSHQLRKPALTRTRRLTTTLPPCTRQQVLILRTTTEILRAGGRVRQRRSTALGRLRRTIRLTRTRAGDPPFRSIATAPRLLLIPRINKTPTIETRL